MGQTLCKNFTCRADLCYFLSLTTVLCDPQVGSPIKVYQPIFILDWPFREISVIKHTRTWGTEHSIIPSSRAYQSVCMAEKIQEFPWRAENPICLGGMECGPLGGLVTVLLWSVWLGDLHVLYPELEGCSRDRERLQDAVTVFNQLTI